VNEGTEKYVRRKPHQREISTVKCRTNQEKIEMQSGKKNKKTGLQQGVFNPLTICPAFYTAVSHIDVSEVTE